MLLRWLKRLRASGGTPPAWRREYGEVFLDGFKLEDIATPEARRERLPRVAPLFLAHWARAVGDMLDTLPPARTLVLRTRDIGPGRHRLAAFAGVPESALAPPGAVAAARPGPSPLEGLPRDWLVRRAEDICGPVHARALARCAA